MKNYLMETTIWYWDAVLLSTTVIVAVPEEWVLIELYFLKMNYEDESYFNDIVCLILLICLNWRRNWYFIIILFRLSNYKHSIPDRRLDNLISRLVIFNGCRMVGTLSHSNVAYTLTDIFLFPLTFWEVQFVPRTCVIIYCILLQIVVQLHVWCVYLDDMVFSAIHG